MARARRTDFTRSLAYVVGINDYHPPVPRLTTARSDALRLAAVLKHLHGYTVRRLTKNVTVDAFNDLRKQMLAEVTPGDRVLFYFAGHGIPPDDTDPRARRAGYLLPQSARLNDRGTCLAMDDLYGDFCKLPCRHLLVILDCCYAGRFRWAATRPGRNLEPVPEVLIFAERYRRFLREDAWQLLASAGQNETAADVLFGERGEAARHSPFAAALLAGLRGEADARRTNDGAPRGDGVIPVYELYAYLEREVAARTRGRQTVSYFPLERHDTGQYVFLVPGVGGGGGHLESALPLLNEHNPYLGLERYDFTPEHERIFRGRQQAAEDLRGKVETQPLTVVVGTSGSGKSSLVRAGVMRQLARRADWLVLRPVQPGSAPLFELAKELTPLLPEGGGNLAAELSGGDHALARITADWLNSAAGQGKHLLLCIDQFEELVTQRIPDAERDRYCRLLRQAVHSGGARLHVVLTVRSDYEARFGKQPRLPTEQQPPLADLWAKFQHAVPPLGREELGEIVVGPATERALVFDPPDLVEDLVNAVFEQPGTLPLLSFTLWKLYRACVTRVAASGDLEDRRLSKKDYEEIGFLSGALSQHAGDLHGQLVPEEQATLRRVMLRLVDLTGPEAVKRRVPLAELDDFDEPEQGRIEHVLQRLDEERLVIGGVMVPRVDKSQSTPCVEPAHDALIRGWQLLGQWIEEEQTRAKAEKPQVLPLIVRRRLTQDAVEWADPDTPALPELLWHNSPHLPLANEHLDHDPLSFNRVETDFIRTSEERRRRNTRQRTAIVVGVIVGLASLAGVAWYQRSQAEARAEIAESRRLAIAAETELREGNLDLALLLAVKACRTSQTIEAVQILREALDYSPYLNMWLRGISSTTTSLAFSHHNDLLASGDHAGFITVWDQRTGRTILSQMRGHESAVSSLAFTNEGTQLMVAYADGVVCEWDPLGGRSKTKLGPSGRGPKPSCVALNSGATHLASGRPDGAVDIFDLGSGNRQELRPFDKGSCVTAVTFSRDGLFLAAVTEDGRVAVCDRSAGQRRFLAESNDRITSLALSHDGTVVAAGSEKGAVAAWDTKTGLPHGKTVKGFTDSVNQLAFPQQNNGLLASVSTGSQIVLWDLKTGEERAKLRGHYEAILALAFSPDGLALASGSEDSRVGLWDLSGSSSTRRQLSQREARVSRAAFVSGTGRFFAAGWSDGFVELWNTAGQLPQKSMSAQHGAKVTCLAFSPKHGEYLVTGAADGTLRKCQVMARRPKHDVFYRHTAGLDGVAFTADGKVLVLAGDDGAVIWIDAATAREIDRRQVAVGKGARLAPDGRTLAWLEGKRESRSVTVLDLLNGRSRKLTFVDSGGFGKLAYSPDGGTLALASSHFYRGISLWDVRGEKWRHDFLPWPGAGVRVLAFNSDGDTLLVANEFLERFDDEGISFWDVERGQQLGQPIKGHVGDVMALSGMNDFLAASSLDGNLMLWDWRIEPMIRWALRIANRPLDPEEQIRFLGTQVDGEHGKLPTLLAAALCVACWSFTLDWTELQRILRRGGWVGAVLLLIHVVLVWQLLSPSSEVGLPRGLPSWTEKALILSGLTGVALGCGWLQVRLGWPLPVRTWSTPDLSGLVKVNQASAPEPVLRSTLQ